MQDDPQAVVAPVDPEIVDPEIVDREAADSEVADPQADPAQDIVVTGFRGSLATAIAAKRQETAAVDSILAEDIGKFPDANLAESMQRIPGVALSRADGGEGRNISVRGLGAGFTRVRINGMEGTSQVGSSDIYGGGNSGRSFDFSVFPSEIFAALAVRKTASADVEEGSLGATVDLNAPHPLDQRADFVLTATGRGLYNELSKTVDPRVSALVSGKFAGGTLGVLGSIAYTKRNIREVGYSAVNILPPYVSGLAQTVPTAPGATTTTRPIFPFCTPVGYMLNGVAVNSPSPAYANNGTSVGATATDCSTGNPRTSTLAAFNEIYNRRGISGNPGGGVFLPRVPRYVNSEQDQDRLGGTLSLQWRPDDRTDISLDGLYSRFEVERRDNFIAAQSFGRTAGNNGQPMTSVRDIQLTEQGSLIYGLFDGVDVRSEGLVERFSSTFRQVNATFRHDFSDSFQISGLAGIADSRFIIKQRLTVSADAIDVDGFSVDFREGGEIPTITYGFDVGNPANFTYAAGRADGTVNGTFSNFKRFNTIENKTAELNARWNVAPGFAVKIGGQYRQSGFDGEFQSLTPAAQIVRNLPAGTTVATISRQITGLDSLLGSGAPARFTVIDQDKWKQATGFDSLPYCGVECGSARSVVREKISSGYLMVTFDTADVLPLSIRGDAGVRYVRTNQFASGVLPVAAPAGAAFPTVGVVATNDRNYDDWLPAANVVVEITPQLLARFGAADVLSRAEYGSLAPAGGIAAVVRTGSFGNPDLDPIRASTLDAALEWYFAPGSLISAAYFHKTISSYIQNVTSLVPFDTLGLPDALLANTTAQPADLFTISRANNTPGGDLNGYELNIQMPFRFLPGLLRNFGMIANYTHVQSRINYALQSSNGVITLSTNAPLVGLSPDTVSGTLYYEDERFTIRSTANYRSDYIRQIPSGANDSDIVGNRSNLFIDASASYNISDNLKLIAEVQNITNERNSLYVDSQRLDPLYTTVLGRTFALGATVRF